MEEHKIARRIKTAERINAAISIASYPIGVFLGAITMGVHIRSRLYKNFLTRGLFGNEGRIITSDMAIKEGIGIREGTTQELQGKIYKVLKEKIGAGHDISQVSKHFMWRYEDAHGLEKLGLKQFTVENPGQVLDVSKLEHTEEGVANFVKSITKAHRKEVAAFFKDIDLRKRDYWKAINQNQKTQTGITGLTFAFVAIIATIAVADHKTILEEAFTGTKEKSDKRSSSRKLRAEANKKSDAEQQGKYVQDHLQRQQEDTVVTR